MAFRYIYRSPLPQPIVMQSSRRDSLINFFLALGAVVGVFLVLCSIFPRGMVDTTRSRNQRNQEVPFVSLTIPSRASARPRPFRPYGELIARSAPPRRFIPTKYRRKRLTKTQKEKVLERYGYQCAGCRRPLDEFDTEYDHIIPLASDPYGMHQSQLNDLSNFQPLCRRCHGYRSWQQRKQGLFQRPRTV